MLSHPYKTRQTPGLVFNGGWINHSQACGRQQPPDEWAQQDKPNQPTSSDANWINTRLYNIELDGGNRVFDIADSATLPDGVPRWSDTACPGSRRDGRLTKTARHLAAHYNTNSYAGRTT